ncbi:sterol desaturase family protein [Flexivirga oryzae]|uniref:Sterol desaturase/sphingolipid hydroxylase (Fatty acid hydroxylase superfamily) n=1 Tax=Flexivirga oryzae TaxID=1794944 RepID=A0A839NCR0_9MICO|nr:sterol desaturase family protein [Flexivirga oryzae]MBB2894649.1 sterol desaturase/sphingolipid hydroxylase (fatty acid hydroxylase superfamily) [Flexivirga oryzae]
MRLDLTVLAIPGFIGAMAAEYAWQRKHPAPPGTRAGDYEFKDTMASLSMGLGSLVAPYVSKTLIGPLAGRGRAARTAMTVAIGATAATTALDVIRKLRSDDFGAAGVADWDTRVLQRTQAPSDGAPVRPVLERITGRVAGIAVASTALVVATEWGARTTGEKFFGRTPLDLGDGALVATLAVLGWDFIYYWNHRLDHEVRWMWAMHEVHHSSEHYNLSTALRQPWGDTMTLYIPYSLLALVGVRPRHIINARAINLLYQFWIHTEAVRSIGWLEKVLNTPSHHRVHHGTNSEYLDRNHGSILIVWDKLFGTFEAENSQPVYGLTKNIDTFNPIRIAGHEWVDMFEQVTGADTWGGRWSYLLRSPGWAYSHRRSAATVA